LFPQEALFDVGRKARKAGQEGNAIIGNCKPEYLLTKMPITDSAGL